MSSTQSITLAINPKPLHLMYNIDMQYK